MCLNVFVGPLHIAVLSFAEDLGDVLPVSKETGQKFSGLLFHSARGEVVIKSWVVSVGEVARRKVGFHLESVVHGHLHDVQDIEPVPVLVLGNPEKLLDGPVYSLGLPVGLGVEST